MKKYIFIFLLVTSILIVFSSLAFASKTVNIKDYIEGKFSSIFSFYLSSLGDLDSYEKEFIDLLERLPEEDQEYYAKEVYKKGFSITLLEDVKEGEKIEIPPIAWNQEKDEESVIKTEERIIEDIPALINKIETSVVVVFAYNNQGEIISQGSGFFINQKGNIVTNYHVLEKSKSAKVKTPDGRMYPVKYILAIDEQNDIICLEADIPSKNILPLSLSKSIPEIGEKIIVYGSPLGLENTVSDGIVSAIRDISNRGKIVQITAPISSGSSGSPVLNMFGEVIGMASFQFIEGQNLNFAIPSEKITHLISTREDKLSMTEEMWSEPSPELSKEIVDTYWNAFSLTWDEKYEDAIPYWEKVIEIMINKTDYTDKVIADSYWNLGTCYRGIQSYSKAIEAFERALYFNFNDYKVHYDLGVLYVLIGDRYSARIQYEILRELDVVLAYRLLDLMSQ